MRKPLVNVSCTNVQKTVVHAHCSVWGWAVSIDLKHAYIHVPIPVLFLMARPTNTVCFHLSNNESSCLYQGGKSRSGTGMFVRSMKAYRPRQLVNLIIIAGMSNQCSFSSSYK